MIVLFMYTIFVLLITLLFEIITAHLMGYKKQFEQITLVLINLITNPLLSLYILAISTRSGYPDLSQLIIFELVVVVIEWILLKFTLRYSTKKMLKLSIAVNAASFILGLILTAILKSLRG